MGHKYDADVVDFNSFLWIFERMEMGKNRQIFSKSVFEL